MVIPVEGLFSALRTQGQSMAGNCSVGKSKGNDAMSLPHPQTERKTIILWNQEHV